MPPTQGELAAFESGIKLGAIYHQWNGTPVSPGTATELEKTIAESTSLQPFVDSCDVVIDREMLLRSLNRFGYAELRGEMLRAGVSTTVGGARASVKLGLTDGYPLMQLVEVSHV